jgi:hypothetical protein
MNGSRTFVDGKGPATVRWIGYLPGLDSKRVGVELDTACDTAHEGAYLDSKYFACKPNTGLFVKESKLNFGKSLLHAIQSRYLATESVADSTLVGQNKAEQFYAKHFYDLRDICLDESFVSGIGDDFEELGNFTAVTKLSLRSNLISAFGDITGIVKTWPFLRVVDVSGNRFSHLFLEPIEASPNTLESLVLNDCVFDSFPDFANFFPVLRHISFDHISELGARAITLPSTISSLSIRNCGFTSWGQLDDFLGSVLAAPLSHLDVSENPLGAMERNPNSFGQFLSLNIANCGIAEWITLRFLSQVCPLLQNLRVTENLFYEESGSVNLHRQILISLFPGLTILNGTSITSRQRSEAERYCASLIVRSSELLPVSVLPDLIKQKLIARYVPKDEGDASQNCSSNTPGSAFRSNLVKLVVKGASESDVIVRIPIQAKVQDLAALISRKIKWPMDLADMHLAVSPPDADLADYQNVESIGELLDYGIDNDWNVYVSLREGS